MLRFLRMFLFVISALMIVGSQLEAGQCQATTKKGSQCKRNAASGSEYCWQHGGSSSTKSAPVDPPPMPEKSETVTKEPSFSPKTVESTQCQATTKKGKQCSRKAKAGSNFCWQHGG